MEYDIPGVAELRMISTQDARRVEMCFVDGADGCYSPRTPAIRETRMTFDRQPGVIEDLREPFEKPVQL